MEQRLGFDIKVERGKQHINDLKPKIAEFLGQPPFSVVVAEESETGDLVYRVRVAEQPPLQWAAIVGDAIHNLHTALDLLTWQLVLSNGGTPNRGTAFPFAENECTFEQSLAKINGFSTEARCLLKNAKPYKGGNEALWQLHQLDIIDKHRLLIPVAAAHYSMVIDFSVGLRQVMPNKEIQSMPLSLVPADNLFPMQDNVEIFRIMAAARSTSIGQPQFNFGIAFGDGDVVKGKPLIPTLEEFVNTVEVVVNSFRHLLAAPSARSSR